MSTADTIMCPHGGRATLFTSNVIVYTNGSPALLEKDIHPVVGCPFTIGSKYSPCVKIEWSAGTARTKTKEKAILVNTSIGRCINAEGAPQGVAIKVNTQTRVDAG